MASVHTLLAQVPTAGAPPEARAIRPATRRPVPRPRVRPPRRALATGIAVVVVAGAVLATVLLVRRSPSPRVDALTRVPAHNALAASPDVVHPGQAFVVSNKGSRARRWHASATEPWLRIAPADGRLGARGAVQVEVDVTSSAPEGDVQADVTVTADDGSTALVHVEGSVEHPPTVAADAEGCQVRATAEDEGEVASVELHWTGSNGPGFAAMAPLADGYAAQVPAEDLPATWWVVAVDGRGNRAQTSERELTAC